MIRGCLIGVGLLAAAMASADEALQIVDDVNVGGILTPDEIYLRNRGGHDLDFYISRNGGPWRLYRIPSGKAALIDARNATIAIATALTDEDGDVETPPALAPGEVTRNQVGAEGLHYYAVFAGSERIDLCWSTGEDRWIAQRPNERRCD